MKRFPLLALALVLASCGCAQPPAPPVPPQPPPIPVPPPDPVPPAPPTPNPVPDAQAATWEAVQKVKAGQTRPEVQAILVVLPLYDTPQDDGTILTEWAAVDAGGRPKYLDVHFSAQGIVIGRVLLPRE